MCPTALNCGELQSSRAIRSEKAQVSSAQWFLSIAEYEVTPPGQGRGNGLIPIIVTGNLGGPGLSSGGWGDGLLIPWLVFVH
mgnify:CR=1 FL=1